MYSKQKGRKALSDSVKKTKFRIFLKLTFLERAKYSLDANTEVSGRASSSKETSRGVWPCLSRSAGPSSWHDTGNEQEKTHKGGEQTDREPGPRGTTRYRFSWVSFCFVYSGLEEVRNPEILISADEKNSNKSLPSVRWQIKDRKLKTW